MRDKFPGFYRPTKVEFDQLWQECIFTFDANVLIDLYSYHPSTREDFFNILDGIKDRTWLSNQAALEYQRKRLTIMSQLSKYDSILRSLPKFNNVDGDLQHLSEHHSLDVNELREKINNVKSDMEDAINDIHQTIESMRSENPDWSHDHDPIRDQLDELFSGRVGDPYSKEQLQIIYIDGEKRYQAKQPPGFADGSKNNERQYGDLIIWLQIIDRAREDQKPIIFVTNDTKRDWWKKKTENDTLGPHPELRQEIHEKAKVNFYMYTADNFMKLSKHYFVLDTSDESIEEVEEIRKYNENVEELSKDIRRELLRESAQANVSRSLVPPYLDRAIDPILRDELLRAVQLQPSPEEMESIRRAQEFFNYDRQRESQLGELISSQRLELERERAIQAQKDYERYQSHLHSISPPRKKRDVEKDRSETNTDTEENNRN